MPGIPALGIPSLYTPPGTPWHLPTTYMLSAVGTGARLPAAHSMGSSLHITVGGALNPPTSARRLLYVRPPRANLRAAPRTKTDIKIG